MTLTEAKELIVFCETKNIRHIAFGQFAVEFFPKATESMKMDPKSLIETFADSMPPDDSMLFASTEDINEDKINSSTREPDNMT